MSILNKLFGRAPTGSPAKQNTIGEKGIVAIAAILGSPSYPFSAQDAAAIFGQKNPSWSRRHPISLLRTDTEPDPDDPDVERAERPMADVMMRLVKSDFTQKLEPCTVLVQTLVLALPGAAQRISIYFLVYFRGVKEKDGGRVSLLMLQGDDTTIQFEPESFEYRVGS